MFFVTFYKPYLRFAIKCVRVYNTNARHSHLSPEISFTIFGVFNILNMTVR